MAVSTVRKPTLVKNTVPILPEPSHKNGNGNGHGFDYLIKAKKALKPKRRNRFAVIFTKAADALVKRGWITGVLTTDEGSMCLVGSINFAINHDAYNGHGNDGALRKLMPFLPAYYRTDDTTPVLSAMEFNDEGTKRKVVNLLRRAAKALDK